MTNGLKKTAAALWLSIFCLALPAHAQDDWQYWNNIGLTAKITEKLKYRVVNEIRLTNDFSQLTHADVDTGFLYQPVSFFEFGPMFRYERERRAPGRKHLNERRYYLEATLKPRFGQFVFANRGRMEYRDRNTTDAWRYRNRFKFSYDFPVRKITLTPFAAEEIFWDITNHEFNQNRVMLGWTTKLSKHVSLDTYYMLRSIRSGSDWDEEHILGTALMLSVG